MNSTKLIRMILSNPILKDKYDITESDLDNINGDHRYQKTVVKVVRQIVSDNDNLITGTRSYNRLKNILNI